MRKVAWLTIAILAVGAAPARAIAADPDFDANTCGLDLQSGTPIVATADGQHVTGTGGDDEILANGFDHVTIDGLGGNDVICGGPGDDVLNGDDGNDLVVGGSGADHIDGGPGNDSLGGGYYVLTFRGESAGDDDDVVLGGDGNDNFEPDLGNGTYAGGTGEDSLGYELSVRPPAPAGGVDFDLPAGTVTHPGAAGTETDHVSGVEAYAGTPWSDRFIGTDGPDTFVGDFGDDYVDARGGDDQVDAAGGPVLGGSGNDSLRVYSHGRVDGGPGDDHVTVYVNDPDENNGSTLGPFAVAGGPGADTTWISSLYPYDEIARGRSKLNVTFDGGTGTDLFVLRTLGTPASGLVHADLAERTATGGRGVARWGPGTNRIAGTGYRDYFSGSSHADYVDARRGDDVIRGLGGNDVLLGGPGHDYVDGGKGRDLCGGEHKISCERRP